MTPEQLEVRRAKQREYQRKWYSNNSNRVQQNRAVRRYKVNNIGWMDELKSGPCADCGKCYDPVCMDWDHLPGFEKKFNVSAMVRNTYSREAIEAEIAKCELVCANCHRIRTKQRR